MSRVMISLEKLHNWKVQKQKNLGTYILDIDEVNRRVYNDLPVNEGEIVKDKGKKVT